MSKDTAGKNTFLNAEKNINAGIGKIGFIGAGKVGTALGLYFIKKGLNVEGYASKNSESAKNAANITGTKAFLSLQELVDECRVIFITVPDGQIGNVWKEISVLDLKGKIICHTSGAETSKIFTGIENKNAFGLSLHPMFAFADKNGKAEGLENACFTVESLAAEFFAVESFSAESVAVESKNTIEEFIKEFFSVIGNRYFVIKSEDKPIYHLANVLASNLVLALLSISCEFMAGIGISENDGLKALMPLIENNINNIKNNGFINSLTGPVERNDLKTVLRHSDVIPDKYKEIYRDLSMRLLELSQKKHPERDYSELNRLLGQ